MTRVTFLVDGFNLYHSLVEASNELGLKGAGTKWLDLKAMCTSFLRYIGRTAVLEEVYYFSALATHLVQRKPDVVKRHQDFVRCLEDSGVNVEMGRFKRKKVHCRLCNQISDHFEEKESDVALAVKLFEVCLNDECEVAVVVTGDTDIAPAIRSVQRLCTSPLKQVWVAFPHNRFNTELRNLVTPRGGTPQSFKISRQDYSTYQFPDPYIHAGGSVIHKPPLW